MDKVAAELSVHLNEPKGIVLLAGFADAGGGSLLLQLGNEAVQRGRKVQGIFHAPPAAPKFACSCPDVRCGGSIAAQLAALKVREFDVLVLEQIVDRESALWAFQFARQVLVFSALWADSEAQARKILLDLEIAPGQLGHDLLTIRKI